MTSRFLAVLILCPFATAQIGAPDSFPKKPVTHEDLWLMHRLGDPAVSPDGARVVFSVTEPSYEPDGQTSDLWIVPVDGSSAPRRLTATKGSESGVTWSPDGTRIAFTAKRDGDAAPRVYVLDMTGPGEARAVTSLASGARAPKWGPDGTRIAFETSVWREAADDAAHARITDERKKDGIEASVYEHFPVRHWDHWLDDRQARLHVVALEGDEHPMDLLAGTELAQRVGFSGRPGLSSDGLSAEWAPDGASLVFVATENRHEAARALVPYHLYRVPADGGEPVRLTRDGASYSSPRFSRDGKHLFAVRTPSTEFVYNLPRLVRFSWPELGAPEVLDPAFDRPVSDYAVSPDGSTVFLIATDEGRRRVFATPADGGETRAVGGLRDYEGGVHSGIACAGEGLVTRWQDSTHPAEIVRLPGTGDVWPQALTWFNRDRVARIDWQPFRSWWFESSEGRRIHSWVALPPSFNPTKKYPVVVLIHGGPHSSSLDQNHVRWSGQLLAAPGHVVLMPDYTGSVGYGEQFARNIQGDPLATPGRELVQAVQAAARDFPYVDASRAAAAGASYGGHLANWLQATTTSFRCLIGHAGLISLEGQWSTSDSIYHRERNLGGPPWEGNPTWLEQSPSTFASKFATPMLLTIGEKDYRVPLNQTLAAWSYLQRQRVPSKLIVFHQANHWVMRGPDARFFWEHVHAWLARWLGAE